RQSVSLLPRCRQQRSAIGTAYFVCANGGLKIDDNEIEALTAAFRRGGIEFVKSLIWKTEPRIGRCWYIGDQWALCYD
ncbi:hypothetical protein AB9F45_39400, partial [Rhizobium leguminosarum]